MDKNDPLIYVAIPEAGFRTIVRNALYSNGYRNIEMDSSFNKMYEAVDLLSPDLLIVGSGFEDEDVFKFIKRLRHNEFGQDPFLPVVLISAEGTRKTVGSAIYSTPYSLAVALLGPKSGPEWFTEETLRNPEILSLAKKIHLVEDPDASGPEYSSVTISVDGKSYKEVVSHPRGDPEDPLGDGELKEKFTHLTQNRFDQDRILQILEMVMNLEEIEDISSLTMLFR